MMNQRGSDDYPDNSGLNSAGPRRPRPIFFRPAGHARGYSEAMDRNEQDERYASTVRTAVDCGLELIQRDLGDDPLLMWFDELLCVVLATHPDARLTLDAVVNGQSAPQECGTVVVAEAVETIRKHASDAAYMIASFHPEHHRAEIGRAHV